MHFWPFRITSYGYDGVASFGMLYGMLWYGHTDMVWYGRTQYGMVGRTCAFRKPFSAVSPRLIVPCTALRISLKLLQMRG